MLFEWDPAKAADNLKKHGVSFTEATTVFGDPFAVTLDDPDHSSDETRFLTVGLTFSGLLLILVHVDRGNKIRIISARKTTKQERKFYEEKTK